MNELERDLRKVLNGHEHGSNTPDFILAKFLHACLAAWNEATTAREQWYGVELRPGQSAAEACARCAELRAQVDDAEGVIHELVEALRPHSVTGPQLAKTMIALDAAEAWRGQYLDEVEAPNRCPNCHMVPEDDGCLCEPLPIDEGN